MQVARFYGPEDLRVEEAREKPVGPHDVGIRPLAVGLCGTDTHILDGTFPAVPGTVLGHEIAGEIVALGDRVDHLARGDLVSVEPHIYCGRCRFCRAGAEHLCLDKKAFGIHLDGGLATHLVVPARCAYVVPESPPPELAALSEPLGCCLHGMDRLDPLQGDSMLIIGAGPAGLMLTRLAVLRGVKLLAVLDLRPERLRAASTFGAHLTLDANRPETAERLLEETGGHGFDTVIDAVGGAPTFELALAHAARGGRILVFGVAPQEASASVKPFDIFAKELTILGTATNPFTHDRAVALLPQMGFDRLDLRICGLADIHDALRAQRTGAAGKIVIRP